MDISTPIVIAFAVFILCGLIIYYLCTGDEKKITIIMDESDSKAFYKFMDILKEFHVLGAAYDDTTDMIRIIVTLRSHDYNDFLRRIKQIQNVEVA